MRRTAAACCFLFLFSASLVEAAITLPVPWKEGMQLRYRSSSSQEKVKGKMHMRVQTQDVTVLEIVEAGPQGFVQRWRSTAPEVAVTGDGSQVALFNYFVAPSLKPGKAEIYEDSIASPWSPDVIPTRGSIELLAVDDKAGTVTIRWRQGIDPAKGAEAAWKMFEAISGVKRSQLEATKGMPAGMVLRDEATIVIARASGLPLRMEHSREVALGNSSSSNRWTFERLPDRVAR